MIRTRKPVKLLEWGEGTNTTNQIWTEVGQGKILRVAKSANATTLSIQLNAAFNKKNSKDNHVKLVQEGERMSAQSARWGEVAMGTVKSVNSSNNTVEIEITTATNIDKRHSVPAWEEGRQ
jgi:hypothetical protein